MAEKERRVLVLGGGAGGLAAAVVAAEAGARVRICEKENRVGRKLLKTGNGRCNLTNDHLSPAGYNRPEFVAPLLGVAGPAELRAWFGTLGLLTVSDEEGRVYPRSDTASSVLDVLRLRCAALGVEECCSREAVALAPEKGGWRADFRDGGVERADAVIVACGGGSRLLESCGVALTPFTPILCPLKTDTEPIKGLSGLRVKAAVSLRRRGEEIFSEAGEVLFRDFGVSGIVILNASRYAKAGDELVLDLLPDMTREETAALLRQRLALLGREELFTGLFHRRVGEALRRSVRSGSPEALAGAVKEFTLSVTGKGDPSSAQVTRGGARTEQFDPLTLECKERPGLYAIGEALDIDGRCGGYNLHWAFVSGLVAGHSVGGNAHG